MNVMALYGRYRRMTSCSLPKQRLWAIPWSSPSLTPMARRRHTFSSAKGETQGQSLRGHLSDKVQRTDIPGLLVEDSHSNWLWWQQSIQCWDHFWCSKVVNFLSSKSVAHCVWPTMAWTICVFWATFFTPRTLCGSTFRQYSDPVAVTVSRRE